MKILFKLLPKHITFLGILISIFENIGWYVIPLTINIYLNDPVEIKKVLTFYIIFICGLLVQTLFGFFRRKFLESTYHKLSFNINEHYFAKICNLKNSRINNIEIGYVNSLISKVCDKGSSAFGDIVEFLPEIVIALGVFFYTSFSQDVTLGLTSIILLTISIIVYIYIYSKEKKIVEKLNEKSAHYSSVSIDLILNLRTIKKMKLADYAQNKLLKTKEDVAKILNRRYLYMAVRWAIFDIIFYLPIIFALTIALFDTINGENKLSFILFYVVIYGAMKHNLASIGRMYETFKEYTIAQNQINEIIVTEIDTDDTQQFESLELTNVHFKYEQANIPISIPNFKVEKGDIVCITGESGQGKTTFLNILTGFLTLKHGTYNINGKPTDSQIDCSFVSQEVELFNTTIKENLCLDKKISDEHLNNLLEETNLLKWLNNTSLGLNEIVGEKGLKLSVGQKQRLNLIRAIIQDKDICVLDEPTSNLDTETELKIISVIKKYFNNKTLIIVTHRPALRSICNKFYHFSESELKEEITE